MSDLISREQAIDAVCREGTRLERNGTTAMCEIKQWCVDILEQLPSAQPETHEKRTKTHACDLISRQDVINALKERRDEAKKWFDELSAKGNDTTRADATLFTLFEVIATTRQLPSAQSEITECPMCQDCPDNCPLEVEHEFN